jgi:hypothetical protein
VPECAGVDGIRVGEMEARDASPHLEPPLAGARAGTGICNLEVPVEDSERRFTASRCSACHCESVTGAAPRCARVGTGATNASMDGLEEPDDKEVQCSERNMSI